MTSRTMAEQLRVVPAADPGRATLNWTLTAPNGRVQRGEYHVTEAQWLHIIKGLEAAREGKQA